MITATVVATAPLESGCSPGRSASASPAREVRTASRLSPEPVVTLDEDQLSSIKIEPVGTYEFSVDIEAVGNIDFDHDLAVPVFPPYPGPILKTFVELGDKVRKGEPLYTTASSDVVQAESTLLAAAASFELTNKALARIRALYSNNGGLSQKELERAIADQQTAQGALKAARDALQIFGKTRAEIDWVLRTRKIDPTLIVRSPVTGRVTSRDSAPGRFVQPGIGPAPFSVANLSKKWMLANVLESDIPLFHVGQPVQVRVMAYPDRVFTGKVSRIYAAVDRETHRVTIRSEIDDSHNQLRPGMLADFTIRVRGPINAVAIPANGVVREGDGTMTAWVTTDRRRFVQRTIKTGLREDGRVQVLAGLRRGELAVSDGAIFLDNMLHLAE